MTLPSTTSIRSRTSVPRRFGWALAIGSVVMVLSFVTRAIVFVRSDHAPAGALTIFKTFAVGALFDILVATWFVAPVMLYLALVGPRRFPRLGQRVLRRTGMALMLAGIVFTAAAEITFFDEFDGRFNFVAVDYLIYPTEVVTNIWQSYPLVWILLGIGGAVFAIMYLLRSRLALFDADENGNASRRWTAVGAYAVALALLTSVIGPGLSNVSQDRVLNEVASSGYFSFFQALLGRDAPYNGLYATEPDSIVQPRLAQLLDRSGEHDTVTRATAPLNIVVVLEESFGSSFVDILHPHDGAPITPSFDSLAAEGVLFTRAYSTGNRTIRAIEATTASLPPLPGVSIVRRPQSIDLFTLPAVLGANGYSTEFVYGGRALFDGMGSYVRANGFQRIVEQKDFPSDAYTTAWGVADEVIFDRALTELDSLHRIGKPFYSLILTVSNHKPYAFPEGHIAPEFNAHKRNNAVRYADWALGRFMRNARTHEFFSNTLFVLMGDHGARVYGSAQIPLPSYEVPILFYKPGTMKPSRVATLTSSLDIPPTVLGLVGAVGPSKFFGRDLFEPDTSRARAFMTHNSELALMEGNRIAVLGLRGAITINTVDSTGAFHKVRSDDSANDQLARDAIAFFQGADATYRRGGLTFDPRKMPTLRTLPVAAGGFSGLRR